MNELHEPQKFLSYIEKIKGKMSAMLTERIPIEELSRSRLTPEWAGLREKGFQLTDCSAPRHYLLLISFEWQMELINSLYADHLNLLCRVARRHLNEIKMTPPPATLAALCAENLLQSSTLAGAGRDNYLQTWHQLASEMATSLSSVLDRNPLTLQTLDQPLLPDFPRRLGELCQRLNADFDTLLQSNEFLLQQYARYLTRSPQTAREWFSLEDTWGNEHMQTQGLDVIEDFQNILHSEKHSPKRFRSLVMHDFEAFFLYLGQASETCHLIMDQLTQCDRRWFSRQLHEKNPHVENQIAMTHLTHHLRMMGEKVEDIECFARKLDEYNRQHQTSCLNILEDELMNLGAQISSQALRDALQETRLRNPNCPLSVKHKSHIAEVIRMTESRAHQLGNGAGSSKPSVPGVGSAKQSA